MYAESEYLKAAIDCGMIDITTLQATIEMAEKKSFLAMHDQKIWQGAQDYWYTYLFIDEKRRVIKKKNIEDLEEYLIKYYRAKQENPTVKEVFYLWLSEKYEMQEIKKGTYDKYENDFIRFFPEIKDRKIKTINADELEMFIRHTIGKMELTNKAYGNFRTLLIGVFKYAKRKKLTEISISTFFSDLQLSRKIFKQNPKDSRTEVFSETETEIIVAHLKEHPSLIHLGMLLCFQTGLRVGELVALKFSDEEEHTLHVQRQEVKYKDSDGKTAVEVVSYTKTEAGNRRIILTDGAKETLRLMREYSNAEYIMQRDRRIRCSTINHELYKVCKRCGLQPRSMHKIRKTYATTLIDAGVDDAITMEMMGHSDITTTRKFYYYSRGGERKKLEQISKAISY